MDTKSNLISITATSIPDAWFQCVYQIFKHGKKFVVQRGSFVGETRQQFPYVVIDISHPYSEPYDSMLPIMPEGSNIIPPVAPGYIEQYLPNLMTDHIEENETYTYGSRIYNQIEFWSGVLRDTPDTNQAVLQVAQPSDHTLDHAPCLRHIDVKVIDEHLWFFPYFRSWDLWGGFPANLAAIAVLQKYTADLTGYKMGRMVSASAGLHVYGYIEEMAKLRVGIWDQDLA